MANQRRRYREMERYMTYVLIGDGVLFLLYLLCAGLGVVWLKILLTVVGILVSGLGIAYLYLTGELTRQRSRWMVAGFGAVILCLLVSLICNYPSPGAPKAPAESASGSGTSDPASGTEGDGLIYRFSDSFVI